MTTNNNSAQKYFADKVQFTTGPMELDEMIETMQEINIIDVRNAEDYEQGHIAGAINLPKESWQTISALCQDKTNIVYSYSETCHLAAKAAKIFSEKGFPVMELQGGFETWKHFDLPVVYLSGQLKLEV